MIGRLREALGPDGMVTDRDVLATHERDATGRWGGTALALVRPRDVDEVVTVVQACRDEGVALVPQGGNTGLVGGGVPRGGEILLSTARFGSVVVDADGGLVQAGAGATLAAVQRAATDAGWRYPVDFAARDSATIGGTVATNAGGHHVLRHGMTRRHVLGIEAVLGTGEVLRHLTGLVKDNTGFDLAGLLCGSEGVLGVITAVQLGLVAPPDDIAVALVGVDDLAAAVGLVGRARRALPDLEAAEVVLADGTALVRDQLGLAAVLDPEPPVTLLLEVAGSLGARDRLATFLLAAAEDSPTALADDRAGRQALWRVREEHNGAIARVGPPHKYDVTVPVDRLAALVDDTRALVTDLAPEAQLWVFGHAGDGNLHLNVTGVAPDDERLDDAVLGLVAAAGGSISAEHGIGVAKRRWLHLARSPVEQSLFRAVKVACDPDGILNPGVLLDPVGGSPPTGPGPRARP
jgi:FAD/FMN-containing dehydrogenase